ncbi:probable phosphoserine aminotransferase [Macrosteles quadrilineatus]|uniref:probable phosphoserine aminotransferase n=1 Tax=Macrosteles quadrilineatus TaxID=74068 RepID=UPI0023E173C1|nr:probable phosphoserine aminotransferase [Macrosteles quadrilineatus]
MSSKKVINFGAGPGKLPEEVMLEVQREFVEYGDSGISVVEMSHRSQEYEAINNSAQRLVRELLDIPDTYSVMFMQGGGTGLFCAVAMNLMSRSGKADYIVTGSWSAKAAKEAAKYGSVNLVLPKTDSYVDVPPQSSWNLDPEASYVYYCDNETVHGLEFPDIPDTKGVPLVADMSSNILTRPFDITKFGVVFAGAQKNIGPSGTVLVIVRRDLLGSPLPITPLVWDFTVMTKDNSLHNTPPTFGVFVMLRVFEWIKRQGGVQEMAARSAKKSSLIYNAIQQSADFYLCPVKPRARSRVNIPFRIAAGAELEAKFLSEAKKRNMIQLKGHRLVGGIRASLYNAVTVEEAQTLADFMKEFQKANS